MVAALLGLGLWASAAARLWSGAISIPLGANELRVIVAPAGLSIGVACLAMALWMIWSSRVGKVKEREHLLDTLAWTGKEQVLDLGCGRGLMLVGAAKRLRTGRAVGIDLWRGEDLAGNEPAAMWANAEAEGVRANVLLGTADMQTLPFAAATFDVVVSRAAVHNLPSAPERRRAMEEIARVLRPGGQVVLSDIRHLDEYVAALRARGLTATIEGSAIGRGLLTVLTFGAMSPGVVRAGRPT